MRVPFSELERRDPKGIYAEARRNRLTDIVGVDLVAEEPIAPNLVIDNYGGVGPDPAVDLVWHYINGRPYSSNRCRSKAETLEYLAPKLRGAKVLPQIRFTVGEWRTDRHAILDRIATARWGGGRLIVRSSARSEDLLGRSSAGKYASVLDVVGAQRTEAQQRAVHVKSWLGEAFRYTLARRTALMRFLDDGIVEIDNRPAAWAIRGMRWTAPSWALAGGDAAAALYTVVQSAVLTGLDPRTYLREVLRRLAADVEVDSQIGTLLPWAFASPTMPAG